MQSKQIVLCPKPSGLPLILFLLLFICGYTISYFIPYLKYAMFGIFVLMCIGWLYNYLNFNEYNIIINTITDQIYLGKIPAKIVRYKHVDWWLSIIYLRLSNNKNKKIYLFVDSVPLKAYKSFRTYSLWT